MKFELFLTDRTRADILRNAEWWAENHSPDQSIVWFDAIYLQLEHLRTMPERFPFAPESSLLGIEIREMPLGIGNRPSYRAIFKIDSNEVHVLTVRRASQDAITTSDIE